MEPTKRGVPRDTDTSPESPTDLPRRSLLDVVKRARVEFKRDNLTDLAASLTYYGLLSIAPAVAVLVAALGLLGRDVTGELVDQVRALAPGSSAELVQTLIAQAQSNRTGAGLGAVLGLLVALWSASGYVSAFMRASNVIYDIPEGRPLWKTVPIRIAVTILAVLVMVISAVIVVVSGPVAQQVGDLVGAGDATLLVWGIVKWPVLLVLVSVLFAVLFWASPNARQSGIKWVSPGGVIAVVLWAPRLRAVRRVRRLLLLVRQDLRVARRCRRVPCLVVADEHRHPPRRGGQRRARARPGHRRGDARGRGALRRAEGHEVHGPRRPSSTQRGRGCASNLARRTDAAQRRAQRPVDEPVAAGLRVGR